MCETWQSMAHNSVAKRSTAWPQRDLTLRTVHKYGPNNWKRFSPGLVTTALTSNSTFPVIGSSAGQFSGGSGPGRFFPARVRFFHVTAPDLAICTSPTRAAQSEGCSRFRAWCSSPGFAAGAAGGGAFFFFAPVHISNFSHTHTPPGVIRMLIIVFAQVSNDLVRCLIMSSSMLPHLLSNTELHDTCLGNDAAHLYPPTQLRFALHPL